MSPVEAKMIVESPANGIDAETGEILPDQSPLLPRSRPLNVPNSIVASLTTKLILTTWFLGKKSNPLSPPA